MCRLGIRSSILYVCQELGTVYCVWLGIRNSILGRLEIVCRLGIRKSTNCV